MIFRLWLQPFLIYCKVIFNIQWGDLNILPDDLHILAGDLPLIINNFSYNVFTTECFHSSVMYTESCIKDSVEVIFKNKWRNNKINMYLTLIIITTTTSSLSYNRIMTSSTECDVVLPLSTSSTHRSDVLSYKFLLFCATKEARIPLF